MNPLWQINNAALYHGNVLRVLPHLPSNSVHSVVTSPPYWMMRDYNNNSEEIGQENTLEEYVDNITKVFKEVYRVLRDDGVAWLNIGDSYTEDDGSINGSAWKCAFSLRDNGWVIRQDIVWYAPNKMPESVTVRCSKSHEYIFMLTKSDKYYFDHIAIRTKTDDNSYANKRSVWVVPVKPYPGSHTATFSPELIEPCILSSTSEQGCCYECGKPYERIVKKIKGTPTDRPVRKKQPDRSFQWSRNALAESGSTLDGTHAKYETLGWRKNCVCLTDRILPCTVLDPFAGTGTTVATALTLNRAGIGVDLSLDYLQLHAIPRINAVVPARERLPAPNQFKGSSPKPKRIRMD